VEADGWSLDDKRNALLSDAKLGPVPSEALTEEEHVKNNLPDALKRWKERDAAERERSRNAQSFCVPKAEIVAHGYDLSLNRYKKVIHEDVDHIPPKQIIGELKELEAEIQQGLADLERMIA
jgi:type I restriction enzyme M protein